MMKKIKIAQIGFNQNSHSIQVFMSMAKQSDIFDIAGYVMPENERERIPSILEHLEPYQELSLEEVLNNPEIEAVTIETEEIYLTKYAKLAAKHGKKIHMEKPGGVSLKDFTELIQIVKEKNLLFHTGYMYRYNPYVERLMERIRAGELGEIISVEAQMNCNHKPEVRQWLENFPGGMMFFLGCHLVDLVLQIKGIPNNVIPLNRCTGANGVTSEDFGMAVFEYDNGVSFVKTNATEIGGFNRRQLVVSGTKGTVEIKPFEVCVDDGQYSEMTEYSDTDWFTSGDKFKSEVYDRYDGMMASFAAMARGEKENPWSYDYELALFEHIIKACGGEKDV